MPIVEAIFLSAAGTFIATYVQNRSREYQQKEQLFKNVSNALDQRLYAMRKLYWSKKYGEKKELQDEIWDAYREVIDKLNMTLNSDFSSVERHLGNDMLDKFKKINYEFIELSRMLWRMRNSDEFNNQEGLEFKKNASKVEDLKSQFTNDMLKSLQPIYTRLSRRWRSKQETHGNPDAMRDSDDGDLLTSGGV